jgi:hypothetical protein
VENHDPFGFSPAQQPKSERIMKSGQRFVSRAPAAGVAYYVIVLAGLAVSLGVIAATFPLLNRITGPEVARNE